MKHAKALSQLTEIRGCGRYVNEFDLTLLKASRGLIVCCSALFRWLVSHLCPVLTCITGDAFHVFRPEMLP